MVFALLLSVLLADLPFPLDEMKFDEKQTKSIEAIVKQHEIKAKPLTAAISKAVGKKKEQLQDNMKDLVRKRDDQIEKVLAEDQQKQFRELSTNGVEIGGKFYRTNGIALVINPSGGGQIVSLRQYVREYSAASAGGRQGSGFDYVATTQVTNRTGRDYKTVSLQVKVTKKSGELVDEGQLTFEDFTNGKTVDVKVRFFSDAQPRDNQVKITFIGGR